MINDYTSHQIVYVHSSERTRLRECVKCGTMTYDTSKGDAICNECRCKKLS